MKKPRSSLKNWILSWGLEMALTDFQMRVGILGGTFDPVHYGHLRFAEEGRELFGLEEIIFIPCGIPPHKEAAKISPAEKRLRMVELAVAGNPRFCVWDIEIKRPWLSYSVETIKEIKEKYGSS